MGEFAGFVGLRRVVWLPSSIFSSFCPLPAIHVQNPNSGQKIKFFLGRKQVEKSPTNPW